MAVVAHGWIVRCLAAAMVTIAIGRPASAQASADLLVSLDWLRAHLNDPHVAVVQIEGASAFDAGHIPGARVIGHDALVAPGAHQLPDPKTLADAFARAGAREDARIVLYGNEPMAIGWAFGALASIGHGDHVSILDGNLKAWTAAGHPVATGASSGPSGRFAPRPLIEPFVVDAPWVRDNLNTPGVRLVDVRTPREWQQGMIPNAEPLLWQELYSDVSIGKFKTPEAIRQVFERAGVTQDRMAVTYCAVGMRASLAYFAARVAGIPARVYRGSWADWSKREGYPIKK